MGNTANHLISSFKLDQRRVESYSGKINIADMQELKGKLIEVKNGIKGIEVLMANLESSNALMQEEINTLNTYLAEPKELKPDTLSGWANATEYRVLGDVGTLIANLDTVVDVGNTSRRIAFLEQTISSNNTQWFSLQSELLEYTALKATLEFIITTDNKVKGGWEKFWNILQSGVITLTACFATQMVLPELGNQTPITANPIAKSQNK